MDIPMNSDKILDAIDIVIESLHRPDDNLRSQAHSMDCYNELMAVRKDVIKCLEGRRKDIKLLESVESMGIEGKLQQYFDLIYPSSGGNKDNQ